MAAFDREVVLQQVTGLLNRELTPTQTYAWALGIMVGNYDELAASDPLAAKIVRVLLELNEDHKVTMDHLEKLDYYRRCLAGEIECSPDSSNPGFEFPDVPVDVVQKWRIKANGNESEQELTLEQQIAHWLRLYVYGFAVYILLWNFWVLLNIGGPWSPKRSMAMITYPFFVYGALLLLPLQLLVSEQFFMIALGFSLLSVAYFWFDLIHFMYGGHFHILGFLLKFFLGAIPSVVTVWLLVYEKYLKDRVEKPAAKDAGSKEQHAEEDPSH